MMSNSYTIGDFIKESSDPLFGYDFIEECINYELISVKYMKESLYIDKEDILESAMVKASEDSASEKASGMARSIMNKITGILKRIGNVLKTYFKKVINKFVTNQDSRIKELEEENARLNKRIESQRKANMKSWLDMELYLRMENNEDRIGKVIAEAKVREFKSEVEELKLKLKSYENEANKDREELWNKLSKLTNRKTDAVKEINEIIKYINIVLSKEITATVSDYVVNFDTYLNKLRSVVWGKSGERGTFIIFPFLNAMKNKSVNELISKINAFKDEIVANKDKKDEITIGYERLKKIKNTIDYYLVDDFRIMDFDHENEEYLSDKHRNIIQNNRDLFSKYLRSIAELSKEFQKMCSVVILSITQYIDMRDFAINIEHRLQDAIYKLIEDSDKKSNK